MKKLLPLFVPLLLLCGCGESSVQLMKDGEKALAQGDCATAVKLLQKASRRITDSDDLFCNLGNAAYRIGELHLAQQAFDTALGLNDRNPVALEGRATVAAYLQEWRTAQELFSKADSVCITQEEKARVQTAWAVCDNMRQKEDLACARLRKARLLSPNYPPALYNLATVYGGKKFEFAGEALDLLEMYVRLVPADSQKALKAKNTIQKFDENRKRNEALSGGKVSPEAAEKLRLAEKAEKAGQLAQALRHYTDYLAIAPFDRKSAMRAATLALQHRNYAQAAHLVDHIIAGTPRYAPAYELMTRIRYAESRYPETRLYGEMYVLLTPEGKARKQYAEWVRTIPAYE